MPLRESEGETLIEYSLVLIDSEISVLLYCSTCAVFAPELSERELLNAEGR